MQYSDIQQDKITPYQSMGQPYQPYQQDSQSFGSLPASPSYTQQYTQMASQLPDDPTPNKQQKPPRGPRAGAILALAVVLLLVFGTGLFSGWQFAQSNGAVADRPAVSNLQTNNNIQPTVPALTGNNIESVREAAIAKVKPAVVQVNVATARGNGLGSGVIIDKRGYIVTNNHVIQGARSIQVVLSNGTRLPAQVVGTDPADDLAVLKINPPAHMTVATLGDSSNLKVGQEVMAIGNPLGITQTVTRGIISALNRSVSEPASQGSSGITIPNTIQTDAAINPGNSGGALIDLQGNVIGIPTLAAIDPEFNQPANGVGFAIPSNQVKFIAQQIIESGKVTHTGRAALGVRVVSVDQVMANENNLSVDHGALIAEIVQGGAAAKAGLQTGDVIVQIDDKEVDDTSSLSDALVTKNPGDRVAVKIYRGNQQLTVNVTLGELQAGS
jgi:S1-C subfamily serine protease